MVGRRITVAAAFLCTCVGGFSQAPQSSLVGQWEGVLSREGSDAEVTLNFADKQGSPEGTMTMLSVGMFRRPLTNISSNSSKVHFEQENVAAVFHGDIRADTLGVSLT